MYGVVTRSEADLDRAAFDGGFFEAKDVTGRREAPTDRGVNMVSCHGDSARSGESGLRTVDEAGRPATRERPYFDWGYVCPTAPGYREELLEFVGSCTSASPDLRLDDVGFARPEYCRCDRCDAAFAASDFDDRDDWRAAVVTDFVEAARELVPGRLYLTLYPDPYPGHLRRRSGLDLAAVEPLIDEAVVPLYDTHYGTTYWLEVIASGFADRLSVPLGVELYAVQVETDRLVKAATVAEAYASDLYLAYDTDRAAAAVDRLRSRGGSGGP